MLCDRRVWSQQVKEAFKYWTHTVLFDIYWIMCGMLFRSSHKLENGFLDQLFPNTKQVVPSTSITWFDWSWIHEDCNEDWDACQRSSYDTCNADSEVVKLRFEDLEVMAILPVLRTVPRETGERKRCFSRSGQAARIPGRWPIDLIAKSATIAVR